MDDVPPPEGQWPGGPHPASEAGADYGEPEERTQEARAAQRELVAHTPGFIFSEAASFGGSLVGGAQHGVSAGGSARDVFMGGKTEIHHHGTASASAAYVSGRSPGSGSTRSPESSSRAPPSPPTWPGCATSASSSFPAPTPPAATPPR